MLNSISPLLGSHDILFITLDTLRYDVACQALQAGQTPHLAALLPDGQWEERHSPGSFTYAAHQAFFAGFLPTPARSGPHPRLLATRFAGSRTIDRDTVTFDTPDIVSGLAGAGYHTICVGGVGFFNRQTPLGRVLPGLFQASYWQPKFGPTSLASTEHQINQSVQVLSELPATQRTFLFLNVSALHSPNHRYLPGTHHDTPASQAAALSYVDSQLPALFTAMQKRAPVITIICSDHGTAYGEDGYEGHRLAHPVVWTVPYADFILEKIS